MKTIYAILITMFLLSACATPQPVQMQSTFNPELHKQFLQDGTGSIKGQGFLRQQGGGVVTCAGGPATMFPATQFFKEIVGLMAAGKSPQLQQSIPPNPENSKMLRESQCDAQGNFTFTGLPAGNWLVLTEVIWVIDHQRQGGVLMREVVVGDGEVQVLLTDNNRL